MSAALRVDPADIARAADELALRARTGDASNAAAASLTALLGIPGVGAVAGLDPRDELATERAGDRLRVRGIARDVAWGTDAAPGVAVAVRHEGAWWLVPSEGAPSCADIAENIAGEPRARLELDLTGEGVQLAGPLPPDELLALLTAAQLVGAMERATELAVEHAGRRRQFGTSLGSFQAVQRLLALAYGESALCSAALVRMLDRMTESGGSGAGLLKAQASASADRIARAAHQVHGAIGYTAEHPLHRLTLSLWAWRDQAGDEIFWNERTARRLAGSREAWPALVELLD